MEVERILEKWHLIILGSFLGSFQAFNQENSQLIADTLVFWGEEKWILDFCSATKGKSVIIVDGKSYEKHLSWCYSLVEWLMTFWFYPKSSGLNKEKIDFHMENFFSSRWCIFESERKFSASEAGGNIFDNFSVTFFNISTLKSLLITKQTHSTPVIRFNFIAFRCRQDWLITRRHYAGNAITQSDQKPKVRFVSS